MDAARSCRPLLFPLCAFSCVREACHPQKSLLSLVASLVFLVISSGAFPADALTKSPHASRPFSSFFSSPSDFRPPDVPPSLSPLFFHPFSASSVPSAIPSLASLAAPAASTRWPSAVSAGRRGLENPQLFVSPRPVPLGRVSPLCNRLPASSIRRQTSFGSQVAPAHAAQACLTRANPPRPGSTDSLPGFTCFSSSARSRRFPAESRFASTIRPEPRETASPERRAAAGQAFSSFFLSRVKQTGLRATLSHSSSIVSLRGLWRGAEARQTSECGSFGGSPRSSSCPGASGSSARVASRLCAHGGLEDDLSEAEKGFDRDACSSPFLVDALSRGVIADGNALASLDRLLTAWTAAYAAREEAGEGRRLRVAGDDGAQRRGSALAEASESGSGRDQPLSFYMGVDLTGGSLHVGHLLPLLLLRRLQRLQLVRPVLLLGTATTLVGDPTGKLRHNFVQSRGSPRAVRRDGEDCGHASLLEQVRARVEDDLSAEAASETRGDAQPQPAAACPRPFCMDPAKTARIQENKTAIARQLAFIFDPSQSDGVALDASLRPEPVPASLWPSARRPAARESKPAAAASPPSALIVENRPWLSALSSLEFLTDFGAFLPLPRLLSRSSVEETLGLLQARRGEASGLQREPRSGGTKKGAHFSFASLAYAVLQAVDWLFLRRNFGVLGQVGGRDQWGNISTGLELARRRDRARLFGLTTPLLLAKGGAKMGKSPGAGAETRDGVTAETCGKTVWLRKDLTPPVEFWQFWRNVDDADVHRMLRWFTLLSIPEIEALEAETQHYGDRALNFLKETLADHVTTLVHGASVTCAVRAVVAAGRERRPYSSFSEKGRGGLEAPVGEPNGAGTPGQEDGDAPSPAEDVALPPTHFIRRSVLLGGDEPSDASASRVTASSPAAAPRRVFLSALLAQLSLCASRAAAKRLLAQGAVRLNGLRLQAVEGDLPLSLSHFTSRRRAGEPDAAALQCSLAVGRKGFSVLHVRDDAAWPAEKAGEHLAVAE
ncbi:tyrosine-tRNA ligase [Besnoitia besnoiti]|uniref:Tyrosyl-tRNA synthetase n=1 Tax=Besnoitia besnoiti TaxID=94643 RepID=A0A2A9MHM4_BESBE|nr:tyrosine-tRNA ligase [Besnoitia besnoiti]PFH37399.1 tyrosine-tRNA ligase [Besnoitia besnoiti]